MIDTELIKKADSVIGDVGTVTDRAARELGRDPDVSQLAGDPFGRLLMAGGGAGVGGALGAGAGGLAGLLGHYTMADEKKRGMKDYLKSILLGGLGGAGVGAVGGGLGAYGMAEKIHKQRTPVGRMQSGWDTFRNTVGL